MNGEAVADGDIGGWSGDSTRWMSQLTVGLAAGRHHHREQRAPSTQRERGGAVVNPAKHPAQLSPSRGLALAAPEQGPWEQHQSQVLSTTHMVGFYGRKCHFIWKILVLEREALQKLVIWKDFFCSCQDNQEFYVTLPEYKRWQVRPDGWTRVSHNLNMCWNHQAMRESCLSLRHLFSSHNLLEVCVCLVFCLWFLVVCGFFQEIIVFFLICKTKIFNIMNLKPICISN